MVLRPKWPIWSGGTVEWQCATARLLDVWGSAWEDERAPGWDRDCATRPHPSGGVVHASPRQPNGALSGFRLADGTAAARAPAPDHTVERLLGSGGIGAVFLGRDVALDRPIAIKVLQPEMCHRRTGRRGFCVARLLASWHPIRTSSRIHKVRGRSSGLFYYTMDYLGEETLADHLERGRFSPMRALRLGVGSAGWSCRRPSDRGGASRHQAVQHFSARGSGPYRAISASRTLPARQRKPSSRFQASR